MRRTDSQSLPNDYEGDIRRMFQAGAESSTSNRCLAAFDREMPNRFLITSRLAHVYRILLNTDRSDRDLWILFSGLIGRDFLLCAAGRAGP